MVRGRSWGIAGLDISIAFFGLDSMSTLLYRWMLKFAGVWSLYQEVVVQERLTNIRPQIRGDLTRLLETVNEHNPFFRGKFTQFLVENRTADDKQFFESYARLPSLSKDDYAAAGQQVMTDSLVNVDPKSKELQVQGRPWETLRRLRHGDYLMPMATGGSSSLPLVVHMTKHHMFSMLFTFFKCWYRMGWRPGHRMMIFYPKNTYNIDDMVKFNRFSWLTGFKYHLFDKIDEQVVRDLVDDLNAFKPKLLLVFPSPLNMIAHTIARFDLPLKHHPEMINVSGETFFDCQRRNAESVFTRSKIEDSYGSVELGEIAHETPGGLEIFANVAYVETEPNAQGQPEMVITRLHMTDFPFIRYRMRDVADVEFQTDAQGNERFVISKIEGKDTNYIMSDEGKRFYPSFFNQFVNELNRSVQNTILEIKVYERNQTALEVQFIIKDTKLQETVRTQALKLLHERLSSSMVYDIKFVDFIDHDYRRKYRVIERIGDIEFAGGIVGDQKKVATVAEIERQAV
jgi:phenylacetate-coenzyme A ligase PaaK-like adenylate-forming protein